MHTTQIITHPYIFDTILYSFVWQTLNWLLAKVGTSYDLNVVNYIFSPTNLHYCSTPTRYFYKWTHLKCLKCLALCKNAMFMAQQTKFNNLGDGRILPDTNKMLNNLDNSVVEWHNIKRTNHLLLWLYWKHIHLHIRRHTHFNQGSNSLLYAVQEKTEMCFYSHSALLVSGHLFLILLTRGEESFVMWQHVCASE